MSCFVISSLSIFYYYISITTYILLLILTFIKNYYQLDRLNYQHYQPEYPPSTVLLVLLLLPVLLGLILQLVQLSQVPVILHLPESEIVVDVVAIDEGGVGDPVVPHAHSCLGLYLLLNSMALMYMLKLPILAI